VTEISYLITMEYILVLGNSSWPADLQTNHTRLCYPSPRHLPTGIPTAVGFLLFTTCKVIFQRFSFILTNKNQ